MSLALAPTYVVEEFTDEEADVLRRYVTNLDGPVFALVNLPEVVKGALFARYSRTHKSLRRLFLDEFVGELDIEGDASIDATVGLRRAEELYDRVFFEYGDDSVAQLGGVHLACEQASNVLTKVLEWGRLMAYLEQSTRYIAYDARLGGRYRYFRDPDVLASPLGTRYVGDMDRLFDAYAELVPLVGEWCKERYPKEPGDSDFVYRTSIKAKALDAVRGILPAGSLSNVGIYGTGQGYEALLLRMRASPLPEARRYADMMLTELRKVIPSFLKRVDLPERGGAWSDYLRATREEVEVAADRLFEGVEPGPAPEVSLVDFDPEGEEKVLAAMLYPHLSLPESQIAERVARMSAGERVALVDAYAGDRSNRRHKPGRALERVAYRFDICSDYGAFRDLQRHRMLTIEWQALSPRHGYAVPEAVEAAGAAEQFHEAMDRSGQLHDTLVERFPSQASYAVSLAYRVRYSMQMNAREAMHLLELRTTPQGHPAYRRVCQEMHRLIAEEAGHHALARMMSFVDHGETELERLDAERRAEQRRSSR
ncbi:MAG TPA: FAD-dependent thymidylate synthase [Acidimicrobiales bacterium]|nr:FAD-dependent thymidylate synthase [Acidimicrobiales bacterium]